MNGNHFQHYVIKYCKRRGADMCTFGYRDYNNDSIIIVWQRLEFWIISGNILWSKFIESTRMCSKQ